MTSASFLLLALCAILHTSIKTTCAYIIPCRDFPKSAGSSSATTSTLSLFHQLSTGRGKATAQLSIFTLRTKGETKRETFSFSLSASADDLLSLTSETNSIPENWRQYVSLGVILVVILDIVLGSPLLNFATAPMKRGMIEDVASDDLNKKHIVINKSRERVDTETIAKEALDKANGAIELRDYLNRNKTEKDRMEELNREIDRKLSSYD
mmetsp:Transcript_4437/g.6578  ORF Transcript_4437/g.6578 Transcript_4437/m.6578 type:complete len:210 (-) Transcript_4437:1781-2410(-)